MQALEDILIQFNPVDHQRVAHYTVFLVNGVIPFTATDLHVLWDEWKLSPSATQLALPQYQNVAPATTKYGIQWVTEKDKFFTLFRQFATLALEGKLPVICLVYPDGTEAIWVPGSSSTTRSHRGPELARIVQTLNPNSQMGMTVVVQFSYNDPVRYYEIPNTRGQRPAYDQFLHESVARAVLDKGYTVSPTLLNAPLPVERLRDFWFYFRNHDSRLVTKYGPGKHRPSPEFQKGLYEKGGFREFFQRFSYLDGTVSKEKLIMASFLHDAGFQYVIYRLGGQALRSSGSSEVFVLDKLPATPGTKLICSKAPKDVRMVVKALYVEQ